LLGMTREQVSSCLMQQWRMPEELVTALRQQHNPQFNGEHSEYAKILYVATRSLRRHGFGDGPFELPEQYVLDDLDLTQEAVDELTANIMEKMDDLNELVSLLNRP